MPLLAEIQPMPDSQQAWLFSSKQFAARNLSIPNSGPATAVYNWSWITRVSLPVARTSVFTTSICELRLGWLPLSSGGQLYHRRPW